MKKLLLLTLAFTLFACSEGDDLNNSATNSVFQGEWSGTFSGDDNGTWTGTVDKNGNSNMHSLNCCTLFFRNSYFDNKNGVKS